MHLAETVVDLGGAYDLPRTLGILQRGHGDPAFRLDPGEHRGGPRGTPGAGAWVCFRVYGWEQSTQLLTRQDDDSGGTAVDPSPAVDDDPLTTYEGAAPSGPAGEVGAVTLRLDQLSGGEVRVRALGSTEQATTAALERAPQLLGAEDDWTGFEFLLDALEDDASMGLARVLRRHPGLRLPATGQLFDQLITVILEQKVTHDQARHSWRNLLRQHGERPPSSSELEAPEWLRLPLSPEQLKAVPSWSWHRLWVQPPLSAAVQRVAGRASAIHRLTETPLGADALAELAGQLTSIPGVGEWTAAEALQRSHAAADLPAVGDWHLPHIVGEALSGRRTDDAGMLRLLEPYRPHRHRVIRLLRVSGFEQQRFGPKLAPEDHRSR